MIQDIAPHTYHNEYKPVAPDENSIILAYENVKSFFRKEDSSDVITLPRFRELEDKAADLYENYIYLFSIDEERFYEYVCKGLCRENYFRQPQRKICCLRF